MKKIKEVTQKDKIIEMERLFDEILKLLPKNSVSLQVHDIDMSQLNREVWEIESNIANDSLRVYLTAKRKITKDPSFDITLFGEVPND
jgi:alkyl hydroperoxide reductase subunit AhpF